MTSEQQTEGTIGVGAPIGVHTAQAGYQPPAIQRLGSLRELTLGGTSGPNDGFGGAGAQGSI